MSKKTKKLTPTAQDVKYDLGCGVNKQPGYLGVDLYAPGADIKADLFSFPWKFASNESASELLASHFLEHVPREKRWPFFEEAYRILKPGGIFRLFVPSWKSERAYGDMTHEWPPVTVFSLLYLSKVWRETNKLTYGPYDIRCNFDHQAGPVNIVGDYAQKAIEVQVHACRHMLETYDDAWITLTKLPMQ